MIQIIKTKGDATRKWIDSFNQYPLSMISQLIDTDTKSWEEVTPISTGDRVYSIKCQEWGTIDEMTTGSNGELVYFVDLENGELVSHSESELAIDYNRKFLPTWNTMWQFGNFEDNLWLVEKDGLQKMADCGFRIYKHKDWGYFFGIDGYGYDFYSEHWLPLYEARGLKWHDDEE